MLLSEHGIDTTQEILVVSNEFHLARTRMLFARVWGNDENLNNKVLFSGRDVRGGGKGKELPVRTYCVPSTRLSPGGDALLRWTRSEQVKTRSAETNPAFLRFLMLLLRCLL